MEEINDFSFSSDIKKFQSAFNQVFSSPASSTNFYEDEEEIKNYKDKNFNSNYIENKVNKAIKRERGEIVEEDLMNLILNEKINKTIKKIKTKQIILIIKELNKLSEIEKDPYKKMDMLSLEQKLVDELIKRVALKAN